MGHCNGHCDNNKLNKTKYFRLRLYYKVSKRAERESLQRPETDMRKKDLCSIDKFVPDTQMDRQTL